MTSTKKNLIFSGLIVLLATLLLLPFFRSNPSTPGVQAQYIQSMGYIEIPEDSPLRTRIQTGRAITSQISNSVDAPATVQANPSMRANIFPPSGGRVISLFVQMGQSVRAGQPLVELYSPEIAEIQTEYNSARSARLQAERELRRKQDLHEKGIAPLRELEEAQTEFEIADSEMNGVLQKLAIMGVDEEDIGKPLVIRSPINGRVIDLQVAVGEFIPEPEDPLMIIADLSEVWVTASIQEKDIRHITTGTRATARFPAYPNENFEGAVLFVGDILDEDTRTTRVRIAFSNSDWRLKPGMFASVTFHSELKEAFLLPSTAIMQRRDFNYVYVETETPFRFEIREVAVGGTHDGMVVIESGLDGTETIIVENAVLLP